MSTPGQKIIKGLQEATRGDFAAVTIDGQRWVRSPAFEAMVEALEAAKRSLAENGYSYDHPESPLYVVCAALALARGERS